MPKDYVIKKTKTEVDDVGNVVSTESYTVSRSKFTGRYVKVFISDDGTSVFTVCSPSDLKMLMMFFPFINAKTGHLPGPKMILDESKGLHGMTYSAITSATKRLRKFGVILRSDDGDFLNPVFLWCGSEAERMAAMKRLELF